MDSQTKGTSSSPNLKAPTYGYNVDISATQQIHVPDHGPPTTRQTRLPIFDQVRNMLNKSTANNKSEEMSSNFPDPHGKPSTWDNVFSTRRYSPNRTARSIAPCCCHFVVVLLLLLSIRLSLALITQSHA